MATVAYILGEGVSFLRLGDDPMSLLNCADIHHPVYDYDLGEVVCRKCGLVLEEKSIEAIFENRHFGAEEAVSRWFRRVANKPKLRPIERSLSALFVRSNAEIAVRRKTCELWRDLRHMNISRGYSASDFSRALLYTAQRLCRKPIVWSMITESAREKNRILRCYRKIRSVLNVEMPRLTSIDYLDLLGTRAGIDRETREMAAKILTDARKTRSNKGNSPIGNAAGALYVASIKAGRRVTQKTMATAAGISEATIRNSIDTMQRAKETSFFG